MPILIRMCRGWVPFIGIRLKPGCMRMHAWAGSPCFKGEPLKERFCPPASNGRGHYVWNCWQGLQGMHGVGLAWTASPCTLVSARLHGVRTCFTLKLGQVGLQVWRPVQQLKLPQGEVRCRRLASQAHKRAIPLLAVDEGPLCRGPALWPYVPLRPRGPWCRRRRGLWGAGVRILLRTSQLLCGYRVLLLAPVPAWLCAA